MGLIIRCVCLLLCGDAKGLTTPSLSTMSVIQKTSLICLLKGFSEITKITTWPFPETEILLSMCCVCIAVYPHFGQPLQIISVSPGSTCFGLQVPAKIQNKPTFTTVAQTQLTS